MQGNTIGLLEKNKEKNWISRVGKDFSNHTLKSTQHEDKD